MDKREFSKTLLFGGVSLFLPKFEMFSWKPVLKNHRGKITLMAEVYTPENGWQKIHRVYIVDDAEGSGFCPYTHIKNYRIKI